MFKIIYIPISKSKSHLQVIVKYKSLKSIIFSVMEYKLESLSIEYDHADKILQDDL